MTDVADFNLWMETTCRAVFSRKAARLNLTPPDCITAPRKSWHDNAPMRIKMTLKNMMPDTVSLVEGVTVSLQSASSGVQMYYHVNAVKCASLEAACERIVAILETGE